jgi:hypothetical protein
MPDEGGPPEVPWVRTTKKTRIWVALDSTNQTIRKSTSMETIVIGESKDQLGSLAHLQQGPHLSGRDRHQSDDALRSHRVHAMSISRMDQPPGLPCWAK